MTSRRTVLTGMALGGAVGVAGALTGLADPAVRRPFGAGSRRTVDVTDFGAVGDGTTDDLRAIMAAVAAVPDGGILQFRPRHYLVSGYVNIQAKRGILVSGNRATIVGASVTEPVVVLDADTDLMLESLYVCHRSVAGGRTGGGFGIKTAGSTGVTIRGCVVHGTTAAGLVTQQSSRVRILDNTVRDTLADGIHTTGSSTNVTVAGNIVSRTGDDGIAVVSYQDDRNPCGPVTITRNVVKASAARGIDVVGGQDVIISGNVVDRTRAAGIMAAQEVSFATYGVRRVRIIDNTVLRAAVITAGGAVSHAAIMVDCADAAHAISGVTIFGNTVRFPRLGGFLVSGVPRSVNDVVISGNMFVGPATTHGQPGFAVTAGRAIYLRHNTAVRPTGNGFEVSSRGQVFLTDNDVRIRAPGWAAYDLDPATTAVGNRG